MSKKLLIPLGVFVVLVRLPAGRALARSARSALAADRQAGAAVHARAAARAGEDARPRRPQGPGLAAQRLGVVVRVVPRGASAAGRARARRRSCRSSASTTRTSPPPASAGSPTTAIRTPCRSSIATGASASTGASTACPRRSSIDKAGAIRYKQIGPLTAEALEKKILPLDPRAAEIMRRRRVALLAIAAHRRCLRVARSSSLRGRRRSPTEKDARRRGARRASSPKSCAASSARTRRSPIPTPSSRRICAGRFASRSPPARPTTRSSPTWSRATATSCSTSRRSSRRRCCSGRAPRCCWSSGFAGLVHLVRARRAEPEAPPLTDEERERAARLLAGDGGKDLA